MLCCISQIYLVGTDAETAYHDEVLGFSQNSSRELSFGTDTNNVNVSCYIFQPMYSIGIITAYRIFSINSSSAREDLKKST